MKYLPLLLLTIIPTLGWSQTNAAAQLEVPNSPIRAQSVFNGLMLSQDTEFLTPDGIIDTLPQQAYVPLPETTFDTIEPAAGPLEAQTADTSPTSPSPTLP